MVTGGIDVRGLHAWSGQLTGLGPAGRHMASLVLRKTALAITADARAFAPVDTGNLRNSITATITDRDAEIGPTASYGAFVEYGTSRNAPAAYLGPAFDRHAGEFLTALGQIVPRSFGGR